MYLCTNLELNSKFVQHKGMTYIYRTLSSVINTTNESFCVLLLNGQRQVGKSTLLKNLCKDTNRKMVTLDDVQFRELAQKDPALFLQRFEPPVLIDEVQYAPQLFPYIKMYVDKHKDEKGAFWLTGSQKYKMMEGVQESLAGRVAILDLFGFSFAEKEGITEIEPFIPSFKVKTVERKYTLNTVFRKIWEGSLPELFVNEKINRELYYSSYIQTYIERDVKDFYNVAKPVQFFNFLQTIAAQTGNLINYSKIANDIGVDVKTIQTWTGILERSGLVYLLYPYYANISKRIIKTPKIYFLDTGLCCYLTKWTSPETLLYGAMSGNILETYVVGEILKSYYHNGKEPALYFYRDNHKNEIDLIIEQDNTLFPIEIKQTANPQFSDYKAFKLLELFDKNAGLGAVVCFASERIPLSREVVSIPVWEI